MQMQRHTREAISIVPFDRQNGLLDLLCIGSSRRTCGHPAPLCLDSGPKPCFSTSKALVKWLPVLALLLCSLLGRGQLLSERVSLSGRSATLGQALQELASEYGISFVYSSYFVPTGKRIELRLSESPLEKVLDKLLAGSRVEYQELNGCIVLKPGKPESEQLSTLQPRRSKPRQSSPLYREPIPRSRLQEARRQLYAMSPLQGKVVGELPGGRSHPPAHLGAYTPSLDALQAAREQDSGDRLAQVSLLPFVGTNLSRSQELTNNLSFNLLWGSNGGVDGLEVGGLGNSVRADMRGLQLAGLGNTIGGDVTGTQLAGLFNLAEGKVTGLQLAGLFNLSGKAEAVQLAGLFNLANEDLTGAQAAGLFNISNGKTDAVQLAGLFNVSGEGAKSQGALLFNRAEDVEWGQMSLLFNKAKRVNGFQLSLINVADTVRGVPIGLINIIRKGYNRVELATSEAFYGNLGFKFGAHRLYNILHLGIRWDDAPGPVQNTTAVSWALGYGLGTAVLLSDRWLLNLEAVAMHVNEEEGWTRQLNLLGQVRATADLRIGRHVHFFAGPVYNLFLSRRRDAESGEYQSNIPPYTFFQKSQDDLSTSMWIGFTGGLRF